MTEEKTIREIVRAIRNEIRDSDLQPDRASELKVKLSAVHGNVLDQIRTSELAYNLVYLAALRENDKANHAKIIAETSGEYMTYREAKDLKEEIVRMMSGLSSFLRLKEDEMRLTPR